jgi:hypothetical protein
MMKGRYKLDLYKGDINDDSSKQGCFNAWFIRDDDGKTVLLITACLGIAAFYDMSYQVLTVNAAGNTRVFESR